MKLLSAILFLSALVCSAQTNIVKVNFADFGLTTLANRRVTMAQVQTNLAAPWLISREPKRADTDTNGTCYFTNVIAGAYDLTLASTPPTIYRIGVTNSGTNILIAAELVSVSAGDANSVTAYTKTQSDARYVRGVAAGTNGIATVTNNGVVTVHFTGSAGGGSGAAYTNSPTLPVGVISGSAIGSNATHLVSVQIVTNAAYTNTLVSTGAVLSAWNTTWVWTNAGAGWYRDANNATRWVTNKGGWWVAEKGIAPGISLNSFTNTTLTGTYYTNSLASEPTPTFYHPADGMFTTNYIYAGQTSAAPAFASDIASTVSNFGGTNGSLYIGMGFRGGSLGFPAYDSDERGFLMSSADLMKWRVSTRPQLVGPAGHLRDCSIMQVGNFFGATYTTNSATNASVAFGFALSTNFSGWTHYTNIIPALSGESLSIATHPEARVWGPYQYDDGTNIHVFVSYTSNLLSTPFHLRKAVTPRSVYPAGLTNWSIVGNATAYTNLIEVAIIYSSNWNALVTGPANQINGDGNKLRQMVFSDANLTNLTLVDADVLGAWGNNVEGIWATPAPDGRIAVGLNYYKELALGAQGDGHAYRVSYANSTMTNYTTPALVDFGGQYIQNFKPFRLTQPTHVANAGAVVGANSHPAGDFYVPSRYGQSLETNTTFFGLNDRTNDAARLALGTETWPLLGFGYSTSRIGQFFIHTPNASGQGNEFYDHGVTNFISVASNWMSLNLPIQGVLDNTNITWRLTTTSNGVLAAALSADAGTSNAINTSLGGKVGNLNDFATNLTVRGGLTASNAAIINLALSGSGSATPQIAVTNEGIGTASILTGGVLQMLGAGISITNPGTGLSSTLGGGTMVLNGGDLNRVGFGQSSNQFVLRNDPVRVPQTPVPVFQPAQTNSAMVLDLMPTTVGGVRATNRLGTGETWIDLVDRDLRYGNSNHWAVARLAMSAPATLGGRGDVYMGAYAGGTNFVANLNLNGSQYNFYVQQSAAGGQTLAGNIDTTGGLHWGTSYFFEIYPSTGVWIKNYGLNLRAGLTPLRWYNGSVGLTEYCAELSADVNGNIFAKTNFNGVGVVTFTNGFNLIQAAFILTNSVPASTASTTNWALQNINGIPTLVATNTAGGGGWLTKALYP